MDNYLVTRKMSEDPYDDMYLEVEITPGFPILGVYDVFMNRIDCPDKNLLILTEQELERLREKLYWKTFSDTIRELERRDMGLESFKYLKDILLV